MCAGRGLSLTSYAKYLKGEEKSTGLKFSKLQSSCKFPIQTFQAAPLPVSCLGVSSPSQIHCHSQLEQPESPRSQTSTQPRQTPGMGAHLHAEQDHLILLLSPSPPLRNPLKGHIHLLLSLQFSASFPERGIVHIFI